MKPIRVWKNYGFCLSPRSGVFWVRTNKHVYFARAPWNEPLFSERYIDKPKSYWGWRFTRRDAPNIEAMRQMAERIQELMLDLPSHQHTVGSVFREWLDEERK